VDTLTLSEADELLGKMRETVAELTPFVCYNCTRCSSGCLAVETGCTPHRIIQLFRLGLLREVEEGIWSCFFCLKCDVRCPQEAKPAMLILAIRNLLVSRGSGPPKGYRVMLENVEKYSTIQQPQETMNKDFDFVSRGDLGLPEMKTPNMEVFRRNLRKIEPRLLGGGER